MNITLIEMVVPVKSQADLSRFCCDLFSEAPLVSYTSVLHKSGRNLLPSLDNWRCSRVRDTNPEDKMALRAPLTSFSERRPGEQVHRELILLAVLF